MIRRLLLFLARCCLIVALYAGIVALIWYFDQIDVRARLATFLGPNLPLLPPQDPRNPLAIAWQLVAAMVPACIVCVFVAGGWARRSAVTAQVTAVGTLAGVATMPWLWERSVLISLTVAAFYALYRVVRSYVLKTTDKESSGPRSLVQRALDAIFGYDFFISYTRRDGGKDYAEALARRLEAAGFQIFFDSDDYAMGDDWKVEGTWALRRTSQLILIASPEALSSPPVIREVKIYSRLRNRRVIPIDFGGTIRNRDVKKPVFEHLRPEILFLEEETSCLETGPTDLVVQKLRDGFNLKRQDQIRSRVFGIVSMVLVSLTIAASGAAWYARLKTKEAVAQLVTTYWNNGVNERDSNNDPIRAAHYFARVAKLAEDPETSMNGWLATQNVQRDVSLVAAFSSETNAGNYAAAIDKFPDASGKSVAAFGSNGTRILSLKNGALVDETGKEIRKVSATYGHNGQQIDGGVLNADGSVLSWSHKDRETPSPLPGSAIVGTLVFSAADDPNPRRTMKHNGQINGALLSPDKTRILSWSSEYAGEFRDVGRSWLWDANTGQPIATLEHSGLVMGAEFNSDGSRILSWDQNGTARLWDVTKTNLISVPSAVIAAERPVISTGRMVAPARGEKKIIGSVVSKDKTRILAWHEDNTGTLWDDENNTAISENIKNVSGAVFNANGSQVLFWDNAIEKTARVWDASDGRPIASFNGGVIQGAVFDPTGTRILSWSKDGTARLWDATGGYLIATTDRDSVSRGETADDGADWRGFNEEHIAKRFPVLQLEVRTGTTLNDAGEVEILPVNEWKKKKKGYMRLLGE